MGTKVWLKWKSLIILCRASLLVAVCLYFVLQASLLHGLSTTKETTRTPYRHGSKVEFQDAVTSPNSNEKQTALSQEAKRNTNDRVRSNEEGIRLSWKSRNRPSIVHCVGENFLTNTWRFKSCHLEHLCYDVESKEYVLFQSSEAAAHTKFLHHSKNFSVYARSSTDFNQTGVSLWPLRPKQKQQAFFPQIRRLEDYSNQEYFELQNDLVWVLFGADALSTSSVSQILFDYMLPIYNLLAMFGLEKSDLLLSTTEQQDSDLTQVSRAFEPLLSMLKLGRGHPPLKDTHQMVVDWITNSSRLDQKARIMCAPHAIIGLGSLTDHGVKRGHGEYVTDYQVSQNVGRGPLLNDFRSYCLENAGFSAFTHPTTLFSLLASSSQSTPSEPDHAFHKQLHHLHRHLVNDTMSYVSDSVNLTSVSWHEQVSRVQRANVVVSAAGESVIPFFSFLLDPP